MWMGPEVVPCQPAAAPVGESKPMYEIVKGIAQKMDRGQYYSCERREDWGEMAMKDVPMSLDEIEQKGFRAGEWNARSTCRGRAKRSARPVRFARDR